MKINKGTMLRLLSLAVTLVLILGAAALLGSCSSGESETSTNYIRVTSDGKKLEMKVMLTETGIDKVYLFALDPWQSVSDITSLSPIAECKVKDNVAQIKYEIVGNISEAICRGYVLAKNENSGYEAVSGIYYVTNPRSLHKDADKNENAHLDNIKGAIGNTSQLLELGAKSTVVTVDLGELMSAEGGIGKIQYTRNGYTCYVDRDSVERLDKKIKSYSDSGIYVFLELVQTKSHSELPESLKCITFPGAEGAEGYALNLTERDGAVKICGILDFLAERYSNGGECGSASAFIIGRNVNNYTKYYAGAASAEASAQNYINTVRMAYNILLSHTPKGRVYVAIDNNWGISNHNSSDFLSTVANMADDGGDFYWQLSVEANASDASLDSIWADSRTGQQPEFISPANIDMLSSLLATGQYTCNSMRRNILLNRFAVGGSNEEARAASYAYAYYKCLDATNIDGLIYAKVTDSADSPIANGLLTAETASSLSERKLIADIFASIDNLADGQVNEIGQKVGSVWEKLYRDHRDNCEKRSVSLVGSSENSGKGTKIHTEFSGGDTYGFTPAAAASYVELRYSSVWGRPVLYTKLEPQSSSEDAGIVSNRMKLKDVKDAGFIGISAMATARNSDTVDITVRLSGYTKDGTEKVLICNSRADSNSWFEAYYNVSDFIKNINSEEITVTILAAPSTAGGIAESLWVSRIVTEGPANGGMPTWLIIVLIVVAVLAAGTVFVLWFRKHYTFVRE